MASIGIFGLVLAAIGLARYDGIFLWRNVPVR